jgi:hypothetical protein
MANRFPLVLDTADGNKIKEIPAGDNLDLRNTSIVDVQNINALGTINAAFVTVNGQQLVAQQFADLTDTPATYAGSEDFFVKVNAAGDGLEYRTLSDLGNIDIDTITVTQDIIPATANTGNVGRVGAQFNSIRALDLIGNLKSFEGSLVFDATTGTISYGALAGAPQFLSEFEDDIGFLRTTDLDAALDGLFGDTAFITDIQGSVFADDSTILVDAVGGVIRGDTEYESTGFIRGQNIVILADNTIDIGEAVLTADLNPSTDGTGSIGTQDTRFGNGYFTTFNATTLETENLNSGLGLGVGVISSATDIEINAGNRVKVTGGVPFKFSSATSTELLGVAGQNGDVIYNTTTNRLQMYQNGVWENVTGNVDAATGTSNFNDVVVAGNLTVQGTTTTIDTDNTTIKDNVIILNQGEAGAGVTLTTSGIEIERGTSPNRSLVWTENFGGKWIVTDDATFLANRLEANYVVGSLSVSTDDLVMTDGNVTATGTLTLGGYGLVQVVSVTTDIELLPVGKVLVDGALEVTGAMIVPNITGDLKGSVFADDSSVLVDSVNGIIPAANLSGTATITVIGDVTGSLTGNADTVTNGVYTTGDQTIGGAKTFTSTVIGNIQGNVTGDVTGNIDNTALTLGATATTVEIGNATSTTTVVGNFTLPNALIVGEITADDSISITTATGDGNAISIGPQGTNTYVNLTADNIRFYGPVVTEINASAGVKGSVTGVDATLLVDAANSIIPSANVSGTEATNWNTAYNWGDHSTEGYLTAIPGTYVQQGEQFVGDVTGTVFADDSSVMVDAVNYAFIGDTMTLNVLTIEPLEPVNGMMAIADGTTWNPTLSGVNTLVVYLNGWKQIQTA